MNEALIDLKFYGRLAEWIMATDLKSVELETVP